MVSARTRIMLLDRKIAALPSPEVDPAALFVLDDLLDERSALMDERDRGYRFVDHRRFSRTT
jgi:hypothetical protein